MENESSELQLTSSTKDIEEGSVERIYDTIVERIKDRIAQSVRGEMGINDFDELKKAFSRSVLPFQGISDSSSFYQMVAKMSFVSEFQRLFEVLFGNIFQELGEMNMRTLRSEFKEQAKHATNPSLNAFLFVQPFENVNGEDKKIQILAWSLYQLAYYYLIISPHMHSQMNFATVDDEGITLTSREEVKRMHLHDIFTDPLSGYVAIQEIYHSRNERSVSSSKVARIWPAKFVEKVAVNLSAMMYARGNPKRGEDDKIKDVRNKYLKFLGITTRDSDSVILTNVAGLLI